MKVYTVTSFDTKSKRIFSVCRESADESLAQIKEEIASIPHDKGIEKVDYLEIMGSNEHCGYVKDNDGYEWFWQTDCINLDKQ